MKFGSLFTGIGGFDLGFERAGMQCAWQVEIEDNCQSLLENRFPNAKRYTDVRAVKPKRLEPVDLICGGFPCQDLSVAGKRAGLAGERSGLWFEFHRIIKGALPRWVIIENVPGLLSSNNGRDFAVVLRGLVECGYGVAWRILDAQHFGVPQRRRRVFVVASLGDGSCAEVLFERESGAGDTAESGEERARVAAPLTRGTSSGRGVNPPGRRQEDDENLVAAPLAFGKTTDHYDESQQTCVAVNVRNLSMENGDVSGTLQSKKSGGYSLNYQNPVLTFDARGNGNGDTVNNITGDHEDRIMDYTAVVVNGNSTPEIGEDCALPLRADDGSGNRQVMAFAWQQGGNLKGREYIARAGDYTGALSETRQDAVAFGHSGGETLKINELANTINAQTGSETTAMIQGVMQRFGVRRLTPTECERLQGFPDGYTDGFSDSVRYRMLGNAVAVPCAYWIAKRIPQ